MAVVATSFTVSCPSESKTKSNVGKAALKTATRVAFRGLAMRRTSTHFAAKKMSKKNMMNGRISIMDGNFCGSVVRNKVSKTSMAPTSFKMFFFIVITL